MAKRRLSLRPVEGANRALRRRLHLKGELALATGPTVTVLGVLALVEVLSAAPSIRIPRFECISDLP